MPAKTAPTTADTAASLPSPTIVLEAALLCAPQPLSLRQLRALLDNNFSEAAIAQHLSTLAEHWQDRGLELVQVASGWRFQSRPALREYLEKLHPEKPQRYGRAVLETLAIIAWRQSVTRGDIEDIRGVAVDSKIIRQLEDRGWVEVIGRRPGPGSPELLATTAQFLDDLGLQSLQDLPMLCDLSNEEQARVLAAIEARLGTPPEALQPDLLKPTGAVENPENSTNSENPENPENIPSDPAEFPAAFDSSDLPDSIQRPDSTDLPNLPDSPEIPPIQD